MHVDASRHLSTAIKTLLRTIDGRMIGSCNCATTAHSDALPVKRFGGLLSVNLRHRA